MTKLLYIALLSVCASSVSFAQESLDNKTIINKTLCWIAESKPVYLVERYVQSQLDKVLALSFGGEPASVDYQELGQQAQEALNILKERQVPVKKISPTSPIVQIVAALAQSDAIYVNEVKLNECSYGVRRCALFHEAVHRKYRDGAMDLIVESVALLVTLFVTYKAIRPDGISRVLRGVIMTSIALGSSGISSFFFRHFLERRADIEGHYATQCYICVQEAAVRRKQLFEVEKIPLKHNGYLWADDLERIAQDLKTQNKFCSYHQHEGDVLV